MSSSPCIQEGFTSLSRRDGAVSNHLRYVRSALRLTYASRHSSCPKIIEVESSDAGYSIKVIQGKLALSLVIKLGEATVELY